MLKRSFLILLSIFLLISPKVTSLAFGQGLNTGQEADFKMDFYDVTFVDSQHGWVVGRSGVILHTSDGGLEWKLQDSQTENHLYSVDFINPAQGWAVGAMGTIVHTDDGGANWERQVSGEDNWLYDIDCINPMECWAVGAYNVILYTSDGGETWKRQGEDLESWGWEDFMGITFISPNEGWIVGERKGLIMHTVDGGVTWKLQESGLVWEKLLGITFDNSSFAIFPQLWAVGAWGTILYTSDGGATWEHQLSDLKNKDLFDIHDIDFVNPTEGWVVGGLGTILHTKNSGTTWDRQTSVTTNWLCGVDFVSPTEGCAVGLSGTILHTDDGGVTWRNVFIDPVWMEICDGVDNDGDGLVDEEGARGCIEFYRDEDGDSYGLAGGDTKCLCKGEGVYMAGQDGDCDDNNSAINPEAIEVCDEVDNNCDGSIDIDEEDAPGCTTFYRDGDGDNYGSDEDSRCLCNPEGIYTVAQGGDLNDQDPLVTPENVISIDLEIGAGWSMVSLSVVPYSLVLSDVFSGAMVVYGYEKNVGYKRVKEDQELQVGKGYWILLDEAQSFTLIGQPIKEYTFSAEDGWYMIGGCSSSAQALVDTGDIVVIYRCAPEFGYQRLMESDNLEPGGGYWILFNNISEYAECVVSAKALSQAPIQFYYKVFAEGDSCVFENGNPSGA
jgi:photosystem II stability/assembly factor-like uncharacterized protein